jgi:hypothetical protein
MTAMCSAGVRCGDLPGETEKTEASGSLLLHWEENGLLRKKET